jgi:hypothetical protein
MALMEYPATVFNFTRRENRALVDGDVAMPGAKSLSALVP